MDANLRLYWVGAPPADVPSGIAAAALTADTPAWRVDALYCTGTIDAALERKAAQLTGYGRETFGPEDDLATLLQRGRSTNYQPIDCNYYDYFEAAIVQRRAVALAYRTVAGPVTEPAVRLRDLRTVRTEEFVQLAGGRWLRLDQVISLDGRPAGGACFT